MSCAALARRAALGDLRVDQRVELARGAAASAPTACRACERRAAGSRTRRRRAPPRTARRRRSRGRACRRGRGRTARASRRASPAGASTRTGRARRPAASCSSARSVSCTIASSDAAMCSRWKAGSMIRRERRWKSPSIVSRPSPISPIRSRKCPSRQREVGRVRDEHVVVGLRPEHEHDVAVEQAQREDRAVALVGLEQHLQRFAREAPRAREREARLARRERHARALAAQVFEHHRERAAVEHRRGPTSAMRVSLVESRRAGWAASFGWRRGARRRRADARAARTAGRAPALGEPWHTGRARKVPLALLAQSRGRSSVG